MQIRAFLDTEEIQETFTERCHRELKLPILEACIQGIENTLEELDIVLEEKGYIPLLCELILMDCFLDKKNLCGQTIFISKKLPKPHNQLTFEHEGRTYKITDLIQNWLKNYYNIDLPISYIEQGFKRLNIQKKRENKYFKLDSTM